MIGSSAGPGYRRVVGLGAEPIVDFLGRPLMVLANARRLPGAVFAGKEYPQSFVERGRSAGLLFYNSVGDEVGGLIYEGEAEDSGYRAVGHLSFDQWQQSQVVALSYSDDGLSRAAGLRIWDRPTEPLEQQFRIAEQFVAATGALRDSLRAEMVSARARVAGTQRVFVGSQNRNAGIEVRDAMGRVRIRLAVDSLGTARLEFLDDQGLAVARYPDR